MGSLCCRIHASPVEAVSLMMSEAKRGYLRCRIHVSPVEAVSLMISESEATQISLIIFEPTRALCDVESIPQPWKQFG